MTEKKRNAPHINKQQSPVLPYIPSPTLLQESITHTSLSVPERRACTSNWDSVVHNYEFDNISSLNLREINKFVINFNNNELIDYNTKLKYLLTNPNKFILLLKTTIDTFDNYIGEPNKILFTKDYINLQCTYDDKTKELIGYQPRSKFVFYNNGKLSYCTEKSKPNNISNIKNTISQYHTKFITHKAFINIVKNIKTLDYNILPDIIKLFEVHGPHALQIAKLITYIMTQDSSHMLQLLIRKLFNNKYEMGNILSIIIHKINTKYIIIKKYIMYGFEPINNSLPIFNDRLEVAFIIDEKKPSVFIKLDIIDIDNIIKNYNPLDKQTSSELKKVFFKSTSNKVEPIHISNYVTPNKINFIYIDSMQPFYNNNASL
jgi:hypothetical protein